MEPLAHTLPASHRFPTLSHPSIDLPSQSFPQKKDFPLVHSSHYETVTSEEYDSVDSEGTGNTPPPVETETETATESSVVDTTPVDSIISINNHAPLLVDSSSRVHVPEPENLSLIHI